MTSLKQKSNVSTEVSRSEICSTRHSRDNSLVGSAAPLDDLPRKENLSILVNYSYSLETLAQ